MNDSTGRDGVAQVATGETDASDAHAALAGDAQAFVRLVHRHQASLARYLRRFTGNEAALQDLCQETYLEAYRSLLTYRGQGPFSRWLRRIASRVGYRYWARQVREAHAKSAYLEMLRYQTGGPSVLHPRDDIESIQRLVACLSHHDRVLIEMRYIRGFKTTEIAQCMKWDTSRVRVRLHRIIRRLRRLHHRTSAA